MILSAHQPQFMPWLGYFDKIRRSGVFVVLDDVQFKKNEWQNRNRILCPREWQWLTVPVIHHFGQSISSVSVNNSVLWRQKHLKTLRQNYSSAPCYGGFIKFFEELYAREWNNLCGLNISSIEILCGLLDINTKIEISSSLGIKTKGSQRLVDICKKLGADTYLAGAGGKDYMDLGVFEQAGIKVVFQDYRHPVYFQNGKQFLPGLSALDIIFNCGDKAAEIIKTGDGKREMVDGTATD